MKLMNKGENPVKIRLPRIDNLPPVWKTLKTGDFVEAEDKEYIKGYIRKGLVNKEEKQEEIAEEEPKPAEEKKPVEAEPKPVEEEKPVEERKPKVRQKRKNKKNKK